MNRALNKKEHCLVSIALFVVMLVVIFLLLEPVWLRHTEKKEEITVLSNRLSNFQSLANQRKALETSYQAMLSESNENGYLLQSSTRGLAIADLQSNIRKIIDQHGGKLVSTQVIKSRDDNDLTLKIRVKSQGDIETVKQVLEGIEASSMILLMDNVTILRNKRTSRVRKLSGSLPLQLNFDLTAFVSGDRS